MSGNEAVELVQRERAITGEAPLWDDVRQVLWWIDIQGRRLLGWHEGTGAREPVHLPSEPGLIAMAEDDRLVLGLEDGLHLHDPETGGLSLLTAIPHGHPNLRLNDGKPDRQGRLWFGSMDKSGSGVPLGALYCRHPGGEVTVARRNVRIPNAITVSPDGGTLYFSDSPTQKVLAFDLDTARGTLSGERVFFGYDGQEKPDGAVIDEAGDLWIAVVHAGRIDRLSAGRRKESHAVPVAKPTMCVFGGPALQDLFITSQRRFLSEQELATAPLTGSLLRLRTASRGAVAARMKI